MRNRAFILDQNDRVISTLIVPPSSGISTKHALDMVSRRFRPGATVTWTIDRADHLVGRIDHDGRFLGTVLLASTALVNAYPALIPLLLPTTKT